MNLDLLLFYFLIYNSSNLSPKLKEREKRKVFSNGFLTCDAENKYETSILTTLYLKPAPRVKYFLAHLVSAS